MVSTHEHLCDLAAAGRVRSNLAKFVVGVVCAGLLVSCGGTNTPSRANVLLITIDTIRADHCSSYGYGRLTTPTLSRVAEAGVIFRNAYAPMATTGPSHATILTSLYPRSHGFVKNGLVLDQRIHTLPESLKAAGYQTAAIVSSFPLAARFGFDQGIDSYDDAFEGHGGDPKPRHWEGMLVERHFDRDARVTTDKASHWLRSQRHNEIPFFLWVHYFDPHAPYRPADGYQQLFLPKTGEHPPKGSLEHTIALYDAEIRETDDALDQLLHVVDGLGLSDSTVVIVAGDHGEGLMQHGQMQHGIHLYEELVRVPLVISWPGNLPAGLEIWEPVELLDVTPTLLEIANVVAGSTDHQGQSLVGVMTGQQTADPERPIFFERRKYKTRQIRNVFVTGNKLGIRSGPWKYIEADEEGTRELFDLRSDPTETSNLVAKHPELAARLSKEISSWLERTPRTFFSPDTVISDEDNRKLNALGYVE